MPEPTERVVLIAESGNGEAFFDFFKRHYYPLRKADCGVRLERGEGDRWRITVPHNLLSCVQETIGFLPPHLRA